MRITLEQLSEIGKVRSHNEDSTGTQLGTPNGDVYVVCDGMGGHVGGAIASSLAVKSILEHFAREKYSNIIQAIDQAFQFANEQIYVHTQVQPELKGMGTTGVILVIKDDKCFFGHVGDSRLYLKTNNELHRLTKDHSYVQELVDKKVITDDEAERHPQKNQILRALGHHSEVKPDVSEVAVEAKDGDVFLLCSDGLNGMLNDEVMNSLIDENDLADSKNKLYQAAMANGGNDNISLMLLGVKDSPYTKSEFKSYSPGKIRRVQEHKYERTQQFATDSTSNWANPTQPKKQSQKWILIAVAALVIIAGGITVYIVTSNKTPVTITGSSNEIHTLEELKSKDVEEVKKLVDKKDSVINVPSGEIKLKDGKTYILTVDSDRLVKIELKNEEKQEETQVKNEEKKSEPNKDQEKNKEQPTKNDPKKDKVLPFGIKSTSEPGVYTVVQDKDEITVAEFRSILNTRNEVKELGKEKRISEALEICQLNNFSGEKYKIPKKTSVKFKVY